MSNTSKKTAGKSASNRMAVWLAGLVVLIGVAFLMAIPVTQAADVVVYKSPTCGCCTKWVDHLEGAGFNVEVQDRNDLSRIKAEHGVPMRLQSCHTAKVGGYMVEGHVPADVIQRMLDEKPDIRGLAVPGMPMGSPGMEGPRKDNYSVIAVGHDGSMRVYARR